jgi:ABC-type transport system involved in cytochrome c biogenesis permease subunit
MVIGLLELTAIVYLVAGLAAGAGLALGHRRLTDVSVGVLAGGVAVHALSFTLLHRGGEAPPLTNTAAAVSFMAWIGTLAFLLILWRARVAGLVVLVAPMAFMGVFFAAVRMPAGGVATPASGGPLAHAHVLLASAGLALLGLAGLAGVLFLAEHRRLKRKRHLSDALALPSLEALDRVNAFSLAVGFPLLTLGVVTGALWVQSVHGRPWTGTAHETWSLVGWAIYAVLVAQRFGAHRGARQCAASAIVGFAFLVFAVLGVELLV